MSDLAEIQRGLGRVEGKLDTALARMDDHEKRLGLLEKWRRWLAGAYWGVCVVLGALAAAVGIHFKPPP
jgi:hypothetical protein